MDDLDSALQWNVLEMDCPAGQLVDDRWVWLPTLRTRLGLVLSSCAEARCSSKGFDGLDVDEECETPS